MSAWCPRDAVKKIREPEGENTGEMIVISGRCLEEGCRQYICIQSGRIWYIRPAGVRGVGHEDVSWLDVLSVQLHLVLHRAP